MNLDQLKKQCDENQDKLIQDFEEFLDFYIAENGTTSSGNVFAFWAIQKIATLQVTVLDLNDRVSRLEGE